MDKNYKPHFLKHLKAEMAARLPEFVEHKVPTGHPQREIFSGSKLYRAQLQHGGCAWISWRPGDGVEREFFVHLGWSFAPDMLPAVKEHDRRLFELRGPSADFAAASLNIQQIEGRRGVGAFVIPTPWDQVLTVKVAAPKREQDAILNKAHAEEQALTDEQRSVAVKSVLEEAFGVIENVLPTFLSQLGALPRH
jgi:hypothetical protein